MQSNNSGIFWNEAKSLFPLFFLIEKNNKDVQPFTAEELAEYLMLDGNEEKRRLLVFVSVSVCNLGYFMTSISKDLSDALNSNASPSVA